MGVWRSLKASALIASASFATVVACSSDSTPPETPAACGGLAAFRFEHGVATDGHADPFGAKGSGQARAGRIRDAGQIVQGPLARAKVRVGDFVLANDKIAVYVEAEDRPNGYAPFGGEILSVDPVGEDGRPLGRSSYNETLIALSRQGIKPDKVTVIADGSDGGAAIVRASGVLANIPFLDTFAALSPEEYNFPAAMDYVLVPGAEEVLLRLHFANATEEPVDFALKQRVGFFQSSRSQIFTKDLGFDAPKGKNRAVAFSAVDESGGFFVRGATGDLEADLEISGFRMFALSGLRADACEKKTVDYLAIGAGGPGVDGTLEAARRAMKEPAWREIRGVVREAGASTIPSAFVHATTADGKYLTRARASEAGEYVLHVPRDLPVLLTPTAHGWAIPAPTSVDPTVTAVDVELPRRATLKVTARDSLTSEPLPVRVQVIPTVAVAPAPPAFGLHEEVNGRLWQEYAITGSAELAVPPGEHRVIVSRGYEYELLDTTVSATAGQVTTVDAPLVHSVDSTGVMCADLHIHSFFSADSSDPVEAKVKGAIADGLEIPVSSEHEWVIDFQPVVAKLGLTKWAFGMPSEELTTFAWGHFGVVPLYPKEDQPNNGAIDWVGSKPPSFFKRLAELPEKPVLIINHPSGRSFQAYFTAASFNRASASGDPELWSEEFGAVEVFNDSDLEANRGASLADYMALLNAGKTYWLVGSSDSHDQRTTPVGYPRTCLRFGHDDPTKLTPEAVRDVLRSGAATVSGGLFMTVEGPSGVGPGGTTSPGEFKVVVQAPSFITADTLEVIVDGVTTETRPLTQVVNPASPVRRYEATINVAPAQSKSRHWVIFHAKGPSDLSPLHPGKKPFAVSNPIFLG